MTILEYHGNTVFTYTTDFVPDNEAQLYAIATLCMEHNKSDRIVILDNSGRMDISR